MGSSRQEHWRGVPLPSPLTGEANTNNEKVKSRQKKKSLLVNVVIPDGHDTQRKKLNHSYEKLRCLHSLFEHVLSFFHMIKSLRI